MRRDEYRWHTELIRSVKGDIKAELDRVFAPAETRARLRFVLAEVARLEADESPLGQLRRYVFIVTSLVHHQRHGGLKQSQVRQLVTLAQAILQANGLKPKSSRLSQLHAELHQILGQIRRKEGRQWSAAWEQSFGNYLAGPKAQAARGFEALGMANRALRLGHVRYAESAFSDAEELGLTDANHAKARLGRIKTLRLAGELDRSLALLELSRDDGRFDSVAQAELTWEELCIEAQRTGDPTVLRKAVARGSAHCDGTYLVEAFLWSHAHQQAEPWQRLPSMRYIARNRDMRPQALGLFYRMALQIERCYDYETPLAVRLRQLGTLLGDASRLVSVDKELLTWAAAARWLTRSKSLALASLALNEYEALSLRLTVGRSHDVLGLAGDLLAKSWYAGGERSYGHEDHDQEPAEVAHDDVA